jgi:hypothetical protein
MMRGHVIVGQIVVENGDDPIQIAAQMHILPGGLFAGTAGDLERPIGFRLHQYAPLDIVPKGKPDEIVDLGVIRMSRLPQADLVPLKGRIVLEEGGDPSQVSATLRISNGPVNSISGGTQGSRGQKPINLAVTREGDISAGGFSPLPYYCSLQAEGFVPKGFPVEFRDKEGADLGTVTLVRPRRMTIEYIVSGKDGFQGNAVQSVDLGGGDHWKATPDIHGWDLRIGQENGELLFQAPYTPCFIADLGSIELKDSLDADPASAKEDPNGMAAKNGHVYLLNQQHWKRNILFKVRLH